MYDVVCPRCKKIRQVKSKKNWMVGSSPFEKICKSCCQVGKEKSQDHKDKLSISAKRNQTEEVRKKKSDFMKSNPELWKKNIVTRGHSFKHSEETKKKIGDGVRKAKKEEI